MAASPLPALALAVGLVFGAGSARAQASSVLERLPNVDVDWTEGRVVATGSAEPDASLPDLSAIRLDAERRADAAAREAALAALAQIRVAAGLTGKAQLARPEVKTRVAGVVERCQAMETRYYSNGGVDVAVHCPFGGGLGFALAPLGKRRSPAPEGEDPVTGLIVDASGLDLDPVLLPTLRVAGAEAPLFAPDMVEANPLRLKGSVVYVRSLGAAREHARVGSAPVVVDATSVGKDGAWVVSRPPGADLDGARTFARELAVVVVFAPTPDE